MRGRFAENRRALCEAFFRERDVNPDLEHIFHESKFRPLHFMLMLLLKLDIKEDEVGSTVEKFMSANLRWCRGKPMVFPVSSRP